MASRIRVIALTLSLSMFLNPITSRAGINALEQNLQIFAFQFCAIMMGVFLKPTTIQTMVRHLRGEGGQHLLGDEERIANEINAMVENNADGIIRQFAHLSMTTFTVTIVNQHHEQIEVSSEQYNRIRSLNSMLANLMPIPYPAEPVLVDLPLFSILQTLVYMTCPVPSSTIETPALTDSELEFLGFLQNHADSYSGLMSSDGILVTLNLLLQIEELTERNGLLFRGNDGESRYRESLRYLLEDYRRILVITDPSTPAEEKKRLLRQLIDQYKEDRSEEYLTNPLTNHYQNQYGAIRYLMHEITTLISRASELLAKATEDLKKKKKESKPIENELSALQAKSDELKRIGGFLVKFRALLKKVEEERFTLFLALKRIFRTELEEELEFADTVNSIMAAEEVGIIPTLIYQSESTFPVTIVSSDNVEIEISSDQYHEIRSLDVILANLMPIPFQSNASIVRVSIPASILRALVFLTSKMETQTTAASSTSALPWIHDEDATLGLFNALQAHLSTYSSLISREGILMTLNFLLKVEHLPIGDRYRVSLRQLLEDYRRILVITDPNTSPEERQRLLKEFIKQYMDDCSEGFLTNPLTNHYENQIAAIRYVMHEITRESEYLNHLPARFRFVLERIEQERFALFLALKKLAIKTSLEEQFWNLDACSSQDGLDILHESYMAKPVLEVKKTAKQESRQEIKREKKSKKGNEKKEKLDKKHEHKQVESESTTASSSTTSSHADAATSSSFLTTASSSTGSHVSGSPRPSPGRTLVRSIEDMSPFRKNIINHNGKGNDKNNDKDKDKK